MEQKIEIEKHKLFRANFVIDADFQNKLRLLALKENRSLSNMLRQIINEKFLEYDRREEESK